MDDLIHADIFFFVTTIAVVVVGIGLSVALYYAVGILRDVRAVVQKVRKASNELEQDFEDLRVGVKNESVRVRTLFELVLGFMMRQIPKPRAKREVKKIPEE
jgi:hypothetical protein